MINQIRFETPIVLHCRNPLSETGALLSCSAAISPPGGCNLIVVLLQHISTITLTVMQQDPEPVLSPFGSPVPNLTLKRRNRTDSPGHHVNEDAKTTSSKRRGSKGGEIVREKAGKKNGEMISINGLFLLTCSHPPSPRPRSRQPVTRNSGNGTKLCLQILQISPSLFVPCVVAWFLCGLSEKYRSVVDRSLCSLHLQRFFS